MMRSAVRRLEINSHSIRRANILQLNNNVKSKRSFSVTKEGEKASTLINPARRPEPSPIGPSIAIIIAATGVVAAYFYSTYDNEKNTIEPQTVPVAEVNTTPLPEESTTSLPEESTTPIPVVENKLERIEVNVIKKEEEIPPPAQKKDELDGIQKKEFESVITNAEIEDIIDKSKEIILQEEKVNNSKKKENIEEKKKEIEITKKEKTPAEPQYVKSTADNDKAEVQVKVEQLRGELLKAHNDSVKRVFEQQLQDSFIRDLGNLNEEELKSRVLSLTQELRDYTSLEVMRLHETLTKQEESLHNRTVKMIAQQAKKYDDLMKSEFQLTEKRISKSCSEIEKRLIEEERNRIHRGMEDYRVLMDALNDSLLYEALIALNENFSKKMRILEKSLSHKQEEEKAIRNKVLDSFKKNMSILTSSLETSAKNTRISNQLHRISLSVLTLEEKVYAGLPFGKELNQLRLSGLGDEYIQTLLASLPSHLVNGMPTLDQLQDRFSRVAEVTRVAALTPEKSGFFGHLMGKVTSFLTFFSAESEIDKVLTNTEKSIISGNISEAIEILQKLQGNAKETASDFIQVGEDRLKVEQALKDDGMIDEIIRTPAEKKAMGRILLLCCIAQFMVVLDVSVVNVALPSMETDLGFTDNSELQWVITAYTVTFGGLILLGGRLGDFFGRRVAFLSGVILFTAASIFGGFANSPAVLIAARAVQGIGGAVLGPATLTILVVTFTDPDEKAKAFGAWGAVASGGGAFGAVIGGILVEYISWRWILFINVPIGISLLIFSFCVLKESRNEAVSLKDIDVLGAITITGGISALVYGISRSESVGWISWDSFWTFLISGALLLTFIITESCISNPLIPFSIFKSRHVLGANLFMFALGTGMFGLFFFQTLWVQLVLGLDPLQTGFSFLPNTAVMMFGSITCAKLTPKYGPNYFLMFGGVTAASGMFWMSFFEPGQTWSTAILGPSIITSLGLGFAFMPVTMLSSQGVDKKLAGLASGLINCTRQVGASIGLSILTTLADNKTTPAMANIPSLIKSACMASPMSCIPGPNNSTNPFITNIATTAAHQALTDGFSIGMKFAALFVLCGTSFICIVPKYKEAVRRKSSVANPVKVHVKPPS